MAQETIWSLKEYKAAVEEIQKSLGSLENGTSKYGSLLNSTVGTLNDNIKKLAEQKEALKDLKQQYKDGTISMTNYMKGERELKISMQDLNKQINIQQKLANASKGSYDDLSQTLSLLKNSYKQLNEAEKESANGKQLAKDIQTLDEYLKQTAASMGEFQRNVGNYASGFKDVSNVLQQFGINVQGLGPAFKVATVAGNGFNGILNTLKAHPFIAVLGVLVATFMKLKDAISKNEETSKKWSVAMSAFKPIINGITNAIDWLATGLVNVVSWVTDSIPKVLRTVGGFAKGVTNLAGNILDVMMFVPRQIVKAYTWMNEKLIDGIKWVIDGVGDLLDMLGFDIGASMKKWTESISKTAKGAMDGLNDSLANAGNYVKSLGNSIDQTMNKWAKATEHQMDLTKQQQKLDKDRRDQEIETEKSLLRQQDLRNKIAEASGKEKKQLLQQLKQEIETNGKKELEIAQRTLDLEKQRRELAPNSREDNLYYEELQKNLVRVQAATSAATVRINKQITSTTQQMTTEMTKAAKEAIQQAHKDSIELVKEVKTALDAVRAGTEQSISELDAMYKESQELGKNSLKEQQNYEDQRHSIIVEGLKKQKATIEEALKSDKLQPQERLNLEITAQRTTIGLINEETRHRINNNKIWLEDRKKTLDEAEKAEKKKAQDRSSNIDFKFTTSFVDTSNQYLEGKLSFEQYQKELTRIQREEEQNRFDEQVRSTEVALKQYEQYMNDVFDKFGGGSDEFKAALEKYNDALAANEQAVNDRKVFVAKTQVEEKNETKAFAEKQVSTYLAMSKGISSVFSKVADIMEENINQKVKNGEISEEQAKEEFERIKKLQIAEAVVNTISGAVGAFMQDKKAFPAPYNYIVAGIDMAATLAAGIAQIQQIKNTQYGSESSGSASSGGTVSSGVSVMPLLNEQADVQSLQNIQTENSLQQNQTQDQRVYILESDIQESNNRVSTRDKSTTF